MNQIWKTNLSLSPDEDGDISTTIETMGMVLSVGLDLDGIPSVWYWAPDDDHRLTTKIILVGTGWKVDDWIGGYKGTFAYDEKILHAFEVSAW